MQVPDEFVPSATQSPMGVSPMSAQPVQPMRNAAPGQLQEEGQATQRLGMEVNDIGERIQNQLDDAMAKNAETGFVRSALTILNGDGKDQIGYLHIRGADAQAQYGDAAAALSKAKQQGLDGLSSDFQKQMFTRVVNQHLMNFGSQMADHRFQQVSEYSAKAANDRADTYVQMATNAYKSIGQVDADGNPTGDFNNFWNQAIQEAQTVAKVGFGADPDSPQAKALAKDKTTAIVQGVLTRMMDDHAYPEAKKFYEDQLAKGNIDERVAETMGNVIKTNSDREYVVNQTNSYIQAALTKQKSPMQTQSFILPVQGGSITSTFGEPRPGDKTHDGIDIAVPVGTSIQAPADGKVLKVWNDEQFGGGLSMQIQHPDGSITGYAHLSAANYKPGDQVTQGQTIGLTGKSGNATGPCLHYTMTSPDGQRIDPGSAGAVQANPQNFTEPDALASAITMAQNNEKDPYLQKEIVSQLESQQRHYRTIQNEDYQQTKQNALDQWYQANGDYTKVPLYGQLKPSDQAELRKGIPVESNQDLIYKFLTDPSYLTAQNVNANRGQLSREDYKQFLEKAASLDKDQSKVRAVELDKDQLETTLATNGMKNLIDPKPGSDDFVNSINLRTNIRDQIDAEQQRVGKELSRDDKQKIIDTTLMNKVSVPGFFGSNQVPAFELTPDQTKKAFVMVGTQKIPLTAIPAGQRMQAISALQKRNMPITEQAIANLWVTAGKPGE